MTLKLSPTEQKIFEFIEKIPACTTSDIAKHFGKTEAWAGPVISIMYNQKKVLSRTHNLEGRGYRWYVAGQAPKFENPMTQEKHVLLVEPPRHAPVFEIESLVDKFVDTLAEEIVSRLRPAIVEKLTDEVQSMSKDIVNKAVLPTKDLKRVLVCGVLSKQGSEMQREFDGVGDVRFVTVDDNAGLWKSRATHADHVILWTNFVSHKHQEVLTGAGVKPIFVTGGLTAVKDKIMELCV